MPFTKLNSAEKRKPMRIKKTNKYFTALAGAALLMLMFRFTAKQTPPLRDNDPFWALRYAHAISADSLMWMVEVLASDSMGGRETGTPEERKVALFLENLFKENRISPVFGEYQQVFEVTNTGFADVRIATDRKEFKVGKDFVSFFPHPNAEFSDEEIVYVGYGIDDPSWNDYAYHDVRGKIVLAKEGEPEDMFGTKILTATERPSQWSADLIHAYMLKRNAALKYGAKAFLYFAPENYDKFKHIYDRICKQESKTVGLQTDSLYDFVIDKAVLEELTGYTTLDSVYYTGRRDRKWTVPVTVSYQSKRLSYHARNLMGKVNGANNARNIILITANFDHLGRENDTLYYPGADNNATGTAVAMELAKAFRKAAEDGHYMDKTLFFVIFTGREKNHLGARYFLKHLPFDLRQVDAVVDLDMLGYNDSVFTEPEAVYTSLHFDSKKKARLLQKLNEAGPNLNVRLMNPQYIYSDSSWASDGVLFYNRHIPVYSFNDGLTYPYNRMPEDTPDKLSREILNRRTRYIFLALWLLANEN